MECEYSAAVALLGTAPHGHTIRICICHVMCVDTTETCPSFVRDCVCEMVEYNVCNSISEMEEYNVCNSISEMEEYNVCSAVS